MADEKNKWLVKAENGHIKGPFTTEEILRKIAAGLYLGKEEVSLYPGGQWIPITKDANFYDQLLEALAGESKTQQSNKRPEVTATNASRAIPSGPAKSKSDKKDDDLEMQEDSGTNTDSYTRSSVTRSGVSPYDRTSGGDDDPKSSRRSSKSKRKKKTGSRFNPADLDVIELINISALVKKEKFKKAVVPLLVAALVIVVALWVVLSDSKAEDRIHLLAPQPGRPSITPAQVASKVKKGVRHYLKDTFSEYLKAQNEFVQVAEGDPRNAEVLALLCMTYYELWPFAYQDSTDLKTISMAAQAASSVDPAGPNGGSCRAVDLIVRGRYIEAKGVVESILDSYGGSAQPPIIFYYLKAKLLEHSNDLQSALGYVTSAQQLWPQWLRVYILEAEIQLKLNNPNESAKRYHQVLKVNPKHIVSKIELGLLEYKYFNHYEKGRELLHEALDSGEKASRPLMARGYFGLAEIALYNNDQSTALKFAQLSYSMNSANNASKNLIVKLGGIEKLKKTKVKGQQLIFEGDQFVREGDCNAAQAHFKAAYEMNKSNGVAAMKAAKCLWEMSFSTESIDWLNKAIKADRKLIEAYTTLADFYTQRFNYLAASQVLAKARSIAPKSYEVYRGYALVELRRNNPQAALNYGKKAAQLYDTDVETQIIMAQAALGIRDFRLAYGHATKATEIDVNNRQAQIVFAEALAGIQGLNSGIDYITNLVNRYPLITDYRLALAKMYMQDESYREAERIYREIINIEEKPKKAYLNLGKVLRLQGNFKDALEMLLQAAVMDPADAEPLVEAGLIYLQVNKPLDARAQFNRVAKINPLYPLIHFYLGQAALVAGDAKTALNEAEKEMRNNPNLADAYLLAAEAHAKLGQYSLCARQYQMAIQLRPQGADIYVKVAKCYRLSGNLDVAITMLTNAASKESGNPEIYKEQGAVYEMKGDIERAVESYNQYFVLDPNAADQTQIRTRIEALQRGARY